MEASVQNEIVDIFRSDPHIYDERRKEIYDLLNPSSYEYSIAKKRIPYEFFSNLLERWVSRNGKDATVSKLWEICKNRRFLAVADQLKEKFPNEFPTTSTSSSRKIKVYETPVSFEVRPEVQSFTGRKEELQKLQEYFDGGKEYIITITGMGGVGKTELAKRFARSLKANQQIQIIWFNGQNQETLAASVDRLKKQLGIELPHERSFQTRGPDRSLTHATRKYVKSTSLAKVFATSLDTKDTVLQSTSISKKVATPLDMEDKFGSKMKKRKLVIIDNVDEVNEDACSLIKAHIPNEDVFFLITSRNLGVLDFVGQIIELGVFPEADAIALVTTSLEPATNEDINSFNDGVKKLCQLLGNFPLALQQAISYLKRAKYISREKKFYKISDYVESYEKRKKKYLDYKLDRINHDYKYTTLFTWQITIDKIEEDEEIGPVAIELLYAVAFFEPDRIPISFAKRFTSGDVDEAIELLQMYSLIKCEDKKLLSIHRLLQEVTRLNVFHTAALEIKQLRKVTQTVVNMLGDMDKELDSILPRKYKTLFMCLSNKITLTPLLEEYREGLWHMISVWEHDSRHPQLIMDFKTIPVNIIDHLNPLQSEFLGNFVDFVAPFAARVHSLFKTIFGPNAFETLEVECMLMLCQWKVLWDSRSRERYELVDRFEEIQERHKSIMAEVNDNPLSLRIRKRFIYMFYYTLIDKEKKYGSNWEYPEIEFAKYCRDFLESVAKVQGSNAIHVSTIRVKWLLALYLGKEDVEVLELLEKLVDDSTSVWGEGHKNTREILAIMADCLFSQKQFARAIPKCQRFLHSANLTNYLQLDRDVRCILSSSFYYVGDRESALQVLENKKLKSLFVEMKRLSHSADELLNSTGDTLEAFKKYQQLNRIQWDFVKDFRLSSILVGLDFRDFFWWGRETSQKIASCLIQLDKSATAVQILKEVIRQWKRIAGEDHPLTIEAKELLQKAEKGLTTDWDHPHHSSSSETKSGQEIPDWRDTAISRYNFD